MLDLIFPVGVRHLGKARGSMLRTAVLRPLNSLDLIQLAPQVRAIAWGNSR